MPNRFVTKHPKGWAVKAPGSKRASSVHPTQREPKWRPKRRCGSSAGEKSASRGEIAVGVIPTQCRPATIPIRRVTGSASRRF